MLDCFIGVSSARRVALTAAQQPVPSPVQVRALIDTGASHTCVDPSIIQPLNLTPSGNVSVHTPTTGGTPANRDQYDISFVILHPQQLSPFVRSTMPIMCTDLLAQGIHALIGRDILQECLFTYNGATGLFVLAY